MTIWQILSTLILGPLGLILACRMIQAVMGKSREGFSLLEAFVLAVCAISIAVSFIGIQL